MLDLQHRQSCAHAGVGVKPQISGDCARHSAKGDATDASLSGPIHRGLLLSVAETR
jgi:hypothetical protein